MIQKGATYALIAFLIPLLGFGVDHAYASVTLSGTVENTSSMGLDDAKVTAEAGGSYEWERTAGDGTWSMTADSGKTYKVDGMKTSYDRDRVSGVSGTTSGIDHELSSRSVVSAKFEIAADEEFRSLYGASWKSTAANKLFAAEPWFEEEHYMTFVDNYYYETWDSDDSEDDCGALQSELESETGWGGGTYHSSDILLGFTTTAMTYMGSGCNALADVPGMGGTHPVIISRHTTSDMARTIMHEITHTYGFSHIGSCSGIIPHIMAPSCGGDYIKNWTPDDDDTIENSRRTWY